MGCCLRFPHATISFIYHPSINICMPEFVPILLLALVAFLLLYLGFSFYSNPQANSPAGFALAAPAQNQPQPVIPFFPNRPERQEIFLGTNFEIYASEGIEMASLEGTLDSSSAETAQALRFFLKPESFDRARGELTIFRTNSAGDISVFINKNLVFKGKPKIDKYIFEIPAEILQDENTVRVETSGGFLFSSSVYDFNLKLFSINGAHSKYRFFVKDQSDRKLEIGFSSNKGWLKILLNGKEVFYGKPEEFLSLDLDSRLFSADENFLELLPEPDSDFVVDFVSIAKKA